MPNECLSTLSAHKDGISSLCFHRGALFSGSLDSQIKVWNKPPNPVGLEHKVLYAARHTDWEIRICRLISVRQRPPHFGNRYQWSENLGRRLHSNMFHSVCANRAETTCGDRPEARRRAFDGHHQTKSHRWLHLLVQSRSPLLILVIYHKLSAALFLFSFSKIVLKKQFHFNQLVDYL